MRKFDYVPRLSEPITKAEAEIRFLRQKVEEQAEELRIARERQINAEEALRERDVLYQSVVDHLGDAVVISSGTKRVFANPSYLELVGVSDLAQVLGSPLDMFIVPEEQDAIRELALARQRGEDVPHRYEYSIRRPDGEMRRVEASVVSIKYEGCPASLAVVRDITERKRSEEALQRAHDELEHRVAERTTDLSQANETLSARCSELQKAQQALLWSEERWTRVVEAVTDAVMTIDINGRFSFANAAAQRLFGDEQRPVVGRRFDAPEWKTLMLDGRPVSNKNRGFHHVMRTGRPTQRGEYLVERPDGTRFAISSQSVPLRDAQGSLIGVVVTTTDISTKQILEEQHTALARLEERQRIAMDLHDGVIQSLYAMGLRLSAYSRDEHYADASGVLRETASQINSAIQQIRNFIFDLRGTEADRYGFRQGMEALAAELRSASLICRELDLDLEADRLLSPELGSDLFQIAREAVSNIIRHADASEVKVGLKRNNRRLILSIWDNGRGIVSNSQARSGQGLRNMRRRASAAGGRLRVISGPGKGTEIRVELPV